MPAARKLARASTREQLRTQSGALCWVSHAGIALRTLVPCVLWTLIHWFVDRPTLGLLTKDARAEVLALTNNYLAAVGLLYAIYLGFAYQSATDRLRSIQHCIYAEAGSVQAIAEYTLTLRTATAAHRATVRCALGMYLSHVLSAELVSEKVRARAGASDGYDVVHRLFGVLGAFHAVGVNDALDGRTLDALQDELRSILRSRAERTGLACTRTPWLQWFVLWLLSILTIAGEWSAVEPRALERLTPLPVGLCIACCSRPAARRRRRDQRDRSEGREHDVHGRARVRDPALVQRRTRYGDPVRRRVAGEPPTRSPVVPAKHAVAVRTYCLTLCVIATTSPPCSLAGEHRAAARRRAARAAAARWRGGRRARRRRRAGAGIVAGPRG